MLRWLSEPRRARKRLVEETSTYTFKIPDKVRMGIESTHDGAQHVSVTTTHIKTSAPRRARTTSQTEPSFCSRSRQRARTMTCTGMHCENPVLGGCASHLPRTQRNAMHFVCSVEHTETMCIATRVGSQMTYRFRNKFFSMTFSFIFLSNGRSFYDLHFPKANCSAKPSPFWILSPSALRSWGHCIANTLQSDATLSAPSF